jgi:hypothetical protein
MYIVHCTMYIESRYWEKGCALRSSFRVREFGAGAGVLFFT